MPHKQRSGSRSELARYHADDAVRRSAAGELARLCGGALPRTRTHLDRSPTPQFVPTDDVALIEANVDGRTLRFQVEDTSYATSVNQPRPQGKARVSVQAQGNRLSINIDFPASSRLSLPCSDFVSAESRQLQVTPPEVRASAMAPAAAPIMAAPILAPASRQAASEDDDDESSSLSDSEVSQRATPMPARDLEPAPRMPAKTQKSEVPLFERAVREQEAQAQREATEAVAREPVMRASGGAAAGGAAPQPFGAVVQSLTADHEAMAMHRVSEDDARIKGRRQEGRIEEAVARHARPSATGVRSPLIA